MAEQFDPDEELGEELDADYDEAPQEPDLVRMWLDDDPRRLTAEQIEQLARETGTTVAATKKRIARLVRLHYLDVDDDWNDALGLEDGPVDLEPDGWVRDG